MVPDDRGRDAEAEAGECPPAPAYRCCSTQSHEERGNDERNVVDEERAQPEHQERARVAVEADPILGRIGCGDDCRRHACLDTPMNEATWRRTSIGDQANTVKSPARSLVAQW